jgi:ElaB/YqjD/DUF883 family membrane-anchored ribosome-binding protein
MFHRRSAEFDPRLSDIVSHLRAIDEDLGVIGRKAGRDAAVRASAAGDQIADTLWPLLSEIGDRFRRGRRVAAGEAASFGNEAVRFGARAGNDAIERIAGHAKQRPLITVAVAIGIGVLIGFAGRRN